MPNQIVLQPSRPWPIGQTSWYAATVDAEDYDCGGGGSTFLDTTAGNAQRAYRFDAVDIETCTDGAPCFDVASIDPGEWLQYAIDVNATASYDLTARVAGGYDTAGPFHVEIDGKDVTGPTQVPNTGGYDIWTDVVVTGIPITAGLHQVRVVMDGDAFNLNSISLN